MVLNSDEPTFGAQKPYVEQVLRILLDGPQPPLVNVNLPQLPQGIRWTHQSFRSCSGKVVAGQDPMGHKHYWFSAVPLKEPDPDSDHWAVQNNLVALTPLLVDLTDEQWLRELQQRDLTKSRNM